MTLDQLGTVVNSGGVVLLLVAALYGGFRGWWYYGAQYRALEKDRDEWKSLALRGANLAETATTIAARGRILTAEESRQAERAVRGSIDAKA